MASIYNNVLNDRELKTVLKPCSHRNYGAYYAIVIFTILTAILLAVLAFKVIRWTCRKLGDWWTERQAVKAYESKQEATLNRFKGFEKDLFISDNTLFYAIRSYKNTEKHLIMYVDFYVRGSQAQYIRVSDTLNEYLNNKLGYGVQSYTGKSEKLKGSKMLIDMGQMYLAQSLTRAYGGDVTVEQIDSCLVDI